MKENKKDTQKNIYRYPNVKRNNNLDESDYEFGDDIFASQLELEKQQIRKLTKGKSKNKDKTA